MAITLTEKAADKIKRTITEKNLDPSTILRVGVVGGGCSGFQYSLGFDTSADPAKDFILDQHGIKIAVDKKSDLFLDGTVIDYYDGLDRSGFVFNNPNAVKTCGCGSSFSA